MTFPDLSIVLNRGAQIGITLRHSKNFVFLYQTNENILVLCGNSSEYAGLVGRYSVAKYFQCHVDLRTVRVETAQQVYKLTGDRISLFWNPQLFGKGFLVECVANNKPHFSRRVRMVEDIRSNFQP